MLRNELNCDVARLTTHVQACLATNQVVANCLLSTDFWLDKITRESRHTSELRHLQQTSLPWTGRRATCTDFVAKRTTTFYFLQQMFATGNNLNCCRTAVWRRPVVKRATSLIQLVLQQCCKTSCAFFCFLFYRTLKDKLTDSMASLDKLFGSITIDWSSLRRQQHWLSSTFSQVI